MRLASCLVTAFLVTSHAVSAAPQHAGTTPAAAARPKRQNAMTLEGRTKSLAAARLRQEAAPTLENERALALEYASVGVPDLALDHFTAALHLDPHDVPSLDGTARIWRDWGYADISLPHAYRAVYWAPDSASAQNTLGTVLMRLGELDAARARFEQARLLAPGAAYPLNNLCYLEQRRARAAEAVALCREAARLDPKSNVVRNNFALALASSGDLDAAFTTFEAGSSPAIAAYNQGIVLLATRQTTRARAAFVRARTADPAFLPAFTRLKQLAAAPVEH